MKQGVMRHAQQCRRKTLCAAVAVVCVMPGCATDPKTGRPSLKETFASEDPCSNNARNIGIAGGAVLGAILGNKLSDGKKGTLIGAAAGAALGALVGHSMDARRCEIARLSKQYGMDVQLTPISEAALQPVAADLVALPLAPAASAQASGLSISVRDDDRQFASDSAQLEPKAAEYFSKVADQYSYAQQSALLARNESALAADKADVEALKLKRILLIGHSDDTGSSTHNADLSERRAKEVGERFKSAGVADSQIFYQGAGETLPIADNRTETGRAQNRRVEIVELADEAALRRYLAARTPKLAYYRPAVVTPSIGAVTSPGKSAVASVPAQIAKRPNTSKAVPAKTEPNGFDFGGSPANAQNLGVEVGTLEQSTKSGFSLISTAVAAGAAVAPSCAQDRPRASRGVKSLRDQKDISFTELMPGLFGSTWSDTVNGNLVALSQVAVYRDGAQPASKPTVLVYRDYKGNRDAKADFKTVAEVNTYRGEKALLYRVFIDGPVRCLDVVLPYGSLQAADSQLLYARNAQLYVAAFKPISAPR
jgi:outer membrane protein OmpA-like peptidoglycan-associated protein